MGCKCGRGGDKVKRQDSRRYARGPYFYQGRGSRIMQFSDHEGVHLSMADRGLPPVINHR